MYNEGTTDIFYEKGMHVQRKEMQSLLDSIAIKEGLSKKELAAKIKVSYVTLFYFYDNKKMPMIRTISKVVNFIKSYGIEIDFVMFDGRKIDIL